MIEDDHPDPTGPETPEEPTAARDGEPSNVTPLPGRNAAERAAEEEDVTQAPEPPPVKGSAQLSMPGMGRKKVPVSSSVSIMSKSHPLEGMIPPDEEVTLVIRAKPVEYKYTPELKGGEVVAYKHVHNLRIVEVAQAGTEHASALLAAEGGAEAAASG